MIYQAIVFMPLIGALLAVPVGRGMGDRAAEVVTTALLIAAAVLSWIVFVDIGFGQTTVKVPVMRWITSGELDVSWSLRIDTLTAVMLVVVTTVSSLVHVYSIGYMHEDDGRARFFCLSVAVHVRHADAGDDRQPAADVLRLGRRRPRVLSADRILVSRSRRQTRLP